MSAENLFHEFAGKFNEMATREPNLPNRRKLVTTANYVRKVEELLESKGQLPQTDHLIPTQEEIEQQNNEHALERLGFTKTAGIFFKPIQQHRPNVGGLVIVEGEEIPLTSRQAQVLGILVESAAKDVFVSMETLIDPTKVWAAIFDLRHILDRGISDRGETRIINGPTPDNRIGYKLVKPTPYIKKPGMIKGTKKR